MNATNGIGTKHVHRLHTLMFLIKYWNINLYLLHVEVYRAYRFLLHNVMLSIRRWWFKETIVEIVLYHKYFVQIQPLQLLINEWHNEFCKFASQGLYCHDFVVSIILGSNVELKIKVIFNSPFTYIRSYITHTYTYIPQFINNFM